MHRGLTITLLVVAIAFIGMVGTVFAAAPVIKPMPDVIIGDMEDVAPTGGISVPYDLFVFTSAFNFEDYVTDADTAKDELVWSFTEDVISVGGEMSGAVSDAFMINGYVSSDEDQDLTGAGTESYDPMAGFRDINASPIGGPNDAGKVSEAFVTFFVTDGTDDDSDTILVKSIDGEYDSLSAASSVPVETPAVTVEDVVDIALGTGDEGDGDFTSYVMGGNPEVTTGWTFTSPDVAVTANGIELSTESGDVYDAGWWTSPLDLAECDSNYVYRVRYSVYTDQADPELVPNVRLQVGTSSYNVASYMNFDSMNGSDCDLGLKTTPTDYDGYLDPMTQADGTNLYVGFYLINMGEPTNDEGAVGLAGVNIDRIAKADMGDLNPTEVLSLDSANGDFSDWTNIAVGFNSQAAPTASITGGKPTLTSTNASAGAFGYYGSSAADNLTVMDVLEGKLLKYAATISGAKASGAATAPELRLRVATEDDQRAVVLVIDDVGANMPTAGGQEYDLYFLVPEYPDGHSASADGLKFFMDLVDFVSTQGGSMALNSLTVDAMDAPGE